MLRQCTRFPKKLNWRTRERGRQSEKREYAREKNNLKANAITNQTRTLQKENLHIEQVLSSFFFISFRFFFLVFPTHIHRTRNKIEMVRASVLSCCTHTHIHENGLTLCALGIIFHRQSFLPSIRYRRMIDWSCSSCHLRLICILISNELRSIWSIANASVQRILALFFALFGFFDSCFSLFSLPLSRSSPLPLPPACLSLQIHHFRLSISIILCNFDTRALNFNYLLHFFLFGDWDRCRTVFYFTQTKLWYNFSRTRQMSSVTYNAIFKPLNVNTLTQWSFCSFNKSWHLEISV